MIDWTPFILTLKLALLTTIILFCIAIPLGYFLSKRKNIFTIFLETLFGLPLVLPPTVLGFYILITLGKNSLIGDFLSEHFDIQLVFSFSGLLIGSIIYSFPFMIQPLQAGFSTIPEDLIHAAMLMGKKEITILLKVVLPNMKSAILSGLVLTFAHTIGEFGVVLMIGGNIPDKTKVASIAIYDYVESMQYDNAHEYAFILLCFSFTILFLLYYFNRKNNFNLK
ncbi:molybdate ABC transporter permease subunit [Flammeovirga sp. EKP202]|uniref:molybdate ABC transporter permease subunit n=1 Tax=Flammeovirga sp. EKP202 TaxID=2770592 RepID=UPI00165F1D29|nr:molybdate ABC transporter permease subunit [Flammeovirga sp. EKP202]MBD0402897.1 molybdate ABC transporter permease subunit [Flammeovirga sp. EKP202]